METFTFHELCQITDFLADLDMPDSDPVQRLRKVIAESMTDWKHDNWVITYTVSSQV